jgi:predicted NACHT family NTPase
MSQLDYKWKRFWCPRGGQINLTDRGYLTDPESEWGRRLNPDLVSLEAIADVPCLVLLGEPGIGKSQEMENLIKHTERQLNPSHSSLVLNLRSCSSLTTDLIQDQDFINWINGEHHLYLFLDSLDEGMLGIQNLATQLADEFRKKKYKDKLSRFYLRIACRTAVFPQILEESLEELWKKGLAIYELAPLRWVDVEVAAKRESIESQGFLSEIWDKNLVPLAIKPVTLKFLLNIYKRHNGQFSSDQTLCNLYLKGCRLLAEEVNPSRLGANLRGNLEADQRLIVAARIAAVTVFANRFAVWTGIDQGDVPAEDVLIRQLILGNETYNCRKTDVTEAAIREVLENSGLFSSRGSNRMGWAHQTYAEFLAAWYLIQGQLELPQILKLIIHDDNLGSRVVPQLYEVVAWLSSMSSEIFQKVMETDADVLLQSDLATIDEAAKVSLVESLLALHDQDKLAYQYRSRNYGYLKNSELSIQLQAYISNSARSISSRYIAIDIAEDCNVQDVQLDLLHVALDTKQHYWVRVRAASAVVHVGDEQTKARLKPLAFGSRDDLEDELKGYALQAVYPLHMTTEEVVNCLTQPKASYIGGHYQDFVAQELGQCLPSTDLLVALKWLEKQSTRRDLSYPFDALSDDIMLKAWEYLEEPNILEAFAEIAFLRIKSYDGIVKDSHDPFFKEILGKEDNKRRQLIEKIILINSFSEHDSLNLLGYSSYNSITILDKDFFWLLESMQSSDLEKVQKIYAQLIKYMFRRKNLKQPDALINEQLNFLLRVSQTNSILKEELDLEPIEIGSSRADEKKAEYLADQEFLNSTRSNPSLLDPPPKERVLTALDQFESGSVAAWWYLCREMTLMPTSANYSERFEADITILPGWQEANEETKLRIFSAAKKYIDQGEPETDVWLGTGSFCHSALAGYKALRLIAIKEPDFISIISTTIWKKWAAIILDYPNAKEDQNQKIRQRLVKEAYQNAPNEFIKALITLIDQENDQNGLVQINCELRNCWDEHLATVLLEKVQDVRLTARSLGDLLKDLLVNQVDQAKIFSKSLIPTPPPTAGEERAKAIVAAKALILYMEDAEWSVVWSAIQHDSEFGREVLESVSHVIKYQGKIEQRIREDYLADLYIFLVQQYPDSDIRQRADSEDKALTGVEAYSVGPEDSVRTWRDYIPQRLQERGTPEACKALRRIIHELPELKDKLQPRLLEAEALVRRQTWQPFQPEEILQIVTRQLSNRSQGVPNVTYNFDQRGATIGVNVASEGSNIRFIQHAQQSISIPEQDLAEAAQKIQALLEQLAQSYPITDEQQEQTFIQKFLERIESTPDLIKVFLAGGIEGLKILWSPAGIPIEVLRRLYQVVRDRHNHL